MKKSFTIYALMGITAVCSVNAQEEFISTKNSYEYEDGSVFGNVKTTQKNLYNSENQLISTITISSNSESKINYDYYDNGALKTEYVFKKDTYTPFYIYETKVYKYDSANRLSLISVYKDETDEVKSYIEYIYEGDNTYPCDKKEKNASNNNIYPWIKYTYEFNEKGKVKKENTFYYYETSNQTSANNSYSYEYDEEGNNISKKSYNSGGTLTNTLTFEYNNGKCISEISANRMNNGTKTFFSYSTYENSFAPSNIKVEQMTAGAKLTWEAPANTDVDGYTVLCGTKSVYVTSNECTLENLSFGINRVVVIAMVGNEEKNCSEEITFEVKEVELETVSEIKIVSVTPTSNDGFEVVYSWEKPQSTFEIQGYIVNDLGSDLKVTTESYTKTYIPYILDRYEYSLTLSVKTVYAFGNSEASPELVFDPRDYVKNEVEGTELLSTRSSYEYEEGSIFGGVKTTNKYLYNSDNQLISQLTIGAYDNGKINYDYYADGYLKTEYIFKKDTYSPYYISETKEYTYDSKKRVSEITIYNGETEEVKSYIVYLYEGESSYPSDKKNMDSAKEKTTLWIKYAYEFNTEGKLSKESTSYYYETSGNTTNSNYFTYEYNGENLISKKEYNANNRLIKNYTYDFTDSKCVTERELNQSGNGTEIRLTYSTYDASYAPTDIKAQEVENGIKISWDAPQSNEIDSYTVYYGTASINTTSTECILEDLPSGINRAIVVANAGENDKNASDEITFEVKETILEPISEIIVESINLTESGSYEIVYSWEKPNTKDEIRGYIVTDLNSENRVDTESYSKIYMPYILDLNNNTITIKVSVVYASGVSESCEPLVFNPVILAGIETSMSDNKISIYPNPTTDIINFTIPSIVKIYGIDGSVILSSSVEVSSFDVTSLSKGSYIVKTIAGSQIATQIIIKK